MIRSALFPTLSVCLRRSSTMAAASSLPPSSSSSSSSSSSYPSSSFVGSSSSSPLVVPSPSKTSSPVRFGHGKQLKKKKDSFSRLTKLYETDWMTPPTPEEQAQLPDIRNMSNLQWRKTDRHKDQQSWACIHQIYPDVLGKLTRPNINLLVEFEGELVYRGNWMSPAILANKPKVAFEPEAQGVSQDKLNDTRWVVMMVDADYPTRDQPEGRCKQHWLVTNIPASGTISDGDTIVEYLRPLPFKNTGTHRYAVLLYRQTQDGQTSFEDLPKIEAADATNTRKIESVDDFAEKYQLDLHSYVFFQSKWDDSVTEYFAKTGAEEPVWESQKEANQRAVEENFEAKRQEDKTRRGLGIK